MNITRTKLSIKVGILAGIIWGLFLSAYYSFVPKEILLTRGAGEVFKFAAFSSTLCLAVLIVFAFAWPEIVRTFKNKQENKP